MQGLTNTLYDCAQRSVLRVDQTVNNDNSTGRWERLLNDTDDARVWTTVNWKCNYSVNDCQNSLTPSDQNFKKHFEIVLNPTDETDYDAEDETTGVNIPIVDEPITPVETVETNTSGR